MLVTRMAITWLSQRGWLSHASNRPPAVAGKGHDLFLAFRKDGVWGDIVHLPPVFSDPAANEIEPRLGPDRHTLYFSSDLTTPITYPRNREALTAELARVQAWDNGQLNIWAADLSPWLRGASGGARGGER